MKLDEIRQRFLDYFRRNGHEVVRSAPLIPEGDPTLLFTNAGMNQFKDLFLGLEKRPYSRATTSQKCFRASGKHNDLENVGRTARHHTFFEMLGNFSFGNYFKPDAIRFAWEFMTVDMALPKDRLWITVYKDDDDAFGLWQKIAGVAPDRILRLGEKDNFWSMGETGPCGPCSEIHYDQGPGVGCGRPECGIECECDRYLELWNLVFMQYNRDAAGVLTPLPRPSIDTGMGLERIAAVMQGKLSNYDSDLFAGLIARIAALTSTAYGRDPLRDISLRVIADHARAMSFLIADGVLPSNEGRGYVLRRIMRRAGRHAKMLDMNEPVLFKCAAAVADLMGATFPELIERGDFVAQVVKNEEERFLETLDAGLRLLSLEVKKAKEIKAGTEQESAPLAEIRMSPSGTASVHLRGEKIWEKRIPGEVAFKLYDTFGFPLDLTQTILADEGLEVDMDGFEKAMEEQRERSRESWKGSGEEVVETVYKEIIKKYAPMHFVGYETTSASGNVLALIVDGNLVERVEKAGAEFKLIADMTPFYGESGGQVGDTGKILGPNSEAEVTDAKRPLSELIAHHCILKFGKISVGDNLKFEVAPPRRADIARNHSATHLLQAALREAIGEHVHQKGSLVTPDRFRFDITHFSAVTPDQLRAIETRVNQWVRENHPVTVQQLSHKEAVAKGAMALFGEKYGDVVRMVEIGGFSRELCGGTHASRTGDIGLFKIQSESSVSSGVRRIEAVTGRAAIEVVQKFESDFRKIMISLATDTPEAAAERAVKWGDQIRASAREKSKAERDRQLSGAGSDFYANVKDVNGVKILITRVDVPDPKNLRALADQVKDKLKSCVTVLASRANDKAHLVAAVTPDLIAKIKAGDIVKEIAPIVGGKGGGRPDFAQAGGPEVDKLEDALKKAEELVRGKL
jgi:alanyl-tRNA synthetase